MEKRNPHHPDWTPPFCPNPHCKHHNDLQQGWRYKLNGHYLRKAPPHRIRRFLCLACRRSFSCQTFSPDYWLKRPDILPRLMSKTCGGMACFIKRSRCTSTTAMCSWMTATSSSSQ